MDSERPDRPDGPGDSGRAGLYGEAVTLGINIVAGVALFTFLGYWADHKRGGGMRWTLVGLGVGLLYSAYEVWKVARLLLAQNGRERGGRRSGT